MVPPVCTSGFTGVTMAALFDVLDITKIPFFLINWGFYEEITLCVTFL